MQTFWARLIGGLCVISALNFAAFAAETRVAQFSVSVKLNVAASASIKDAVTSCLDRELRALHDVTLVGDRAQWEINVAALEVKSTRGYRGGVAISTVVASRFQNESIAPFFRPADKASGLTQTSGLWEYLGHYLHMDSLDRLQATCRLIVADFERDHVEKGQRRFREMRESVKPLDGLK